MEYQNNVNELFIIINLTIVGCGKTYIYDILEEENKENIDINLFKVSSDHYRVILIDEYFRSNKTNDFRLAFKNTFKNLKIKFNNYLSKYTIIKVYQINKNVVCGKTNLLYLDKCFAPSYLEANIKEIRELCLHKTNIKKVNFILFYPKSNNGIYFENFFYPFSIEFIIQCYYRIKLRKNHETLDATKREDFYAVLFMFLQFFKNFHYAQVYKYSLFFMKQEISYTDDSEIEIPEEQKIKILSLLESILAKLDIVEIPLGTEEMRDLIQIIESNYPINLFKDTKEEIRGQIKQFLEEFYDKSKLRKY